MIEIQPNLYVGSQDDYEGFVKNRSGWSVVQACKEPYHREALGYYSIDAPANHPEYSIARRENRLILNLVDVNNIEITKDIIMQSLAFIDEALNNNQQVLIHCNMGMSRSASIALLYLASQAEFIGLNFKQAQGKFKKIYPPYLGHGGISNFIAKNWEFYNPFFDKVKRKLVFIDNTAHHLYGQQHLFTAFSKNCYDIILICPNDNNYFIKLQKLGFKCYDMAINGKGINPFQDYVLIKDLKCILRTIDPHLICSFTIKPNLYASIAARALNIPIIPNITGLGYIFTGNSNWLLKKIVVGLYKFAFKKLSYVFFQNDDDKQVLQKLNIFPKSCELCTLPGDGVDLNKFKYVGYTHNTRFLYSGRLLWDKGLGELIAAMRIVKDKYSSVTLSIIGNYFEGNPSAVSQIDITNWQNAGLCEYLGMVDNVAEVIAQHDCVVLPSYREGLPRALLEASAVGKPIITVNTVGCKDVVIPNITGLICHVKDSNSLAQSMLEFIELDVLTKQQMGQNGRELMQEKFDQQIVVQKYLQVANSII